MAGLSSDLEVLKDIPGYKAILKSVLKSQIQLLIEQLSDHTGEETIILTASVHDGTLSHLGSITGKGFLDGRDEIKSQFLAFCLKSHHKRKSTEARSSPYQRPQSGGQGDRLTPSQSHTHKRARIQPVSLQRAGTGESTGNSFTPPDMHRAPSQSFNTNGQDTSSGINVKLESSEQSVSSADSTNYATTSVSFPTSLQLSHTQTSAEPATSDNSEIQNDDDFTEQTSENDDSTAASIKIEPITENEMELEITGVEPGKSSASVDSWGQGQMPGTSAVGEGVPTEAGDQSGYRDLDYPYKQRSADEHETKNKHMSRKISTISGKNPSLRIPKMLPIDSSCIPRNELFEKELRNPVSEPQVVVKSEPIEEFGIGSATFSQNIPETQTSRHLYNVNNRLVGREVAEVNNSQVVTGSERQSEEFRSNRKADIDVENRNTGSTDKEVPEKFKVKTRKGLSERAEFSERPGNENNWNRTISIGKPKKHSDKHRRQIREYVDEMVGQIRNETDKCNKKIKIEVPEVRNREDEKKDAKSVDNVSKYIGVQIMPVNAQSSDLGVMKEEEKGKKKKKNKKQSKKNKTKNHDSDFDNSFRSNVNPIASPRIGLSKPYNSPHYYGPKQTGNSIAIGWKYSCSFCPTKCSSEYGFKRHMWVHTRSKPFHCSHCPLEFIRREHFRQHMFYAHPGLPY